MHIQHGDENPEHATTGLTWAPVAGAETEVTVRTVRLDNTGRIGHVGDELVSLRITNLSDLTDETSDKSFPFVETDLDPADARMLAAALVCEAERAEAKRRQDERVRAPRI